MKRGRALDEDRPEFERLSKKSRHSYILCMQETQMQYEEHIREIRRKMSEMEARIVLMEQLLAKFTTANGRVCGDKWNYYIS